MDKSAQQEQFSNAYIQAIASVAGYSMAKPNVDDDSVDWIIGGKSNDGHNKRPKLEIQLKSCTRRNCLNGQSLSYSIPIKNYDDLRLENKYLSGIPRLLIVVHMPVDINQWLESVEQALKLKYCAYWYSFEGQSERNIQGDKISVAIPRTQQFTVERLTTIMSDIGRGKMPCNLT